MSAPLFAQIRKTFLKQPMTSVDVSLIVNSLVDCYGNLMTIGALGSPFYFTISPGGSDEEICSATAITQNSDGTCTISGLTRGLAAVSTYAGGGTANQHGASAPVIFMPDNPQLLNSIVTYVNGLVLAAAVAASDTVYGYVKTTENVAAPRVTSALVSQQASPNMTVHVQPFAHSTTVSIVNYAGGDTGTLSAPVTNPRIDLVVYSTTLAAIRVRTGSENVSPVEPTPTSGDIVLASIFLRVGSTTITERDGGTNAYIKRWYVPGTYTSTYVPQNYAADSGAANAYVVTLSPAPIAYTAGMMVNFLATNANTTTSTLNVNGLGAKTIKKNVSVNLASGDIGVSQDISVIYDGTNFQLLNQTAGLPGGFSSGQTTHDVSSNAAQTIAHGLSGTPRMVKVTAILGANSASWSIAFFTYAAAGNTINGAVDVGAGTNALVANTGHLYYNIGSPLGTTMGIGAPDATNINLTWSKDATSTGTAYLLWEAYL